MARLQENEKLISFLQKQLLQNVSEQPDNSYKACREKTAALHVCPDNQTILSVITITVIGW